MADHHDAAGRRVPDGGQRASGQSPQQSGYMFSEQEFKDENYIAGLPHIGRVMIINNYKFKNEKGEDIIRTNSSHDCQKLKEVFDDLRFEGVKTTRNNEPKKVFENLTKKDLEKLLKDASDDQLNDYTDYSCFVCIILSYGETGVIDCLPDNGSKGSSKYEVAEIQKFFKGDNCETLKMKPKIFLIQAAEVPKDGKDDPRPAQDLPIPKIEKRKIPREADILTHFSSLPEILFVQDNDIPDVRQMSIYPAALRTALKHYVSDPVGQDKCPMDLLKLLTRVNSLVLEFLGKVDLKPDINIQIPVVSSTLTKHMYFNVNVR